MAAKDFIFATVAVTVVIDQFFHNLIIPAMATIYYCIFLWWLKRAEKIHEKH